jgi:hypothetical protein
MRSASPMPGPEAPSAQATAVSTVDSFTVTPGVLSPEHAAEADDFPNARLSIWRRRIRNWTRILFAYFSTQTATQLLGIAAGLLLVRNMPIQEFALYTLATSVLTFYSFATDLGSTSSLVHFFHRALREGDDFRHYLAAVLSLRRSAFALGAVVVVVALPAVARAKGYRPLEIALVTAAVLPAVGFQIVASVRQLALRLDDRYRQSYQADLGGGALRLLLVAGMVVSALLHSWIGVMAAAAASAATAWLAGPKRGAPSLHPAGSGVRRAQVTRQEADLRPYRRAVLRYMLPTLPSALYFSVQGPLVVWLAATFGASRNIAEVGSLTRLGLLVGVFSGLTGVLFLPRLARITDDRAYRMRALQFGAVHLTIAGLLLLAAWVAPEPFLWLLGPHYTGLQRELLLVVAGSGLALLGGYAVGVNFARSWTRWESGGALVLAAFQAVAIASLPLNTTQGLLLFNLLSAGVGLAFQLAIGSLGFLRPRWVQWR